MTHRYRGRFRITSDGEVVAEGVCIIVQGAQGCQVDVPYDDFPKFPPDPGREYRLEWWRTDKREVVDNLPTA